MRKSLVVLGLGASLSAVALGQSAFGADRLFAAFHLQSPSAQAADKPKSEIADEARKTFNAWIAEWGKRTGVTLPRRQINDLEEDYVTGANYIPTVEKENKISKNQAMMERLERISKPLADIAADLQVKCSWGDGRLNPLPYKFRLIEGKDVNAFSLPGGFIFVYEGLMSFVESDDELAAVLAHEISHASLRHLATMVREQSKFDTYALPAMLIAILKGGDAGIGIMSLSQLAGMAMQSGWSVKAEVAADWAGFQYMQASNYNPVAALTFMERLAQKQRALDHIDWGIYRTHPPSRERADYIGQYLRGAKLTIRRSEVATSFRVVLKPDPTGVVEGMFGTRRLFRFKGSGADKRATDAAAKLNDFLDSVPELFEVQATADGSILGRNSFLFRYSVEDASGDSAKVEELAMESAQAIKRSLYTLAFRIWNVK